MQSFNSSSMGRWSLLLGILLVGSVILSFTCGEEPGTNEDVVTGKEEPQVDSTIVISSDIPRQVVAPLPVTADNRIFFDTYSWNIFIALNWPVLEDQRGQPRDPDDQNAFLNSPANASVVWTSYKNQTDLFGQGKSRPSAWNDFENPVALCDQPVNHVFGLSKTPLEPDIDEAFSYPLVDQQNNYTLYEIRYNQEQYDFIRGTDGDSSSWLYIQKNLMDAKKEQGGGIVMPASTPEVQGSIMLKAAWRVMTAEDDTSKFYLNHDIVYDPVTEDCRPMTLGLVGLHIVQKTAHFTEWIWSSFEHIDNVPGPGAEAPYSYNNGTGDPATRGGWANRPNSFDPQPATQRSPAQVVRYNDIPTSTQRTNARARELLKGTVWENYQLIITQWPANSAQFTLSQNGGVYPQDCGQAFPENGCTNTTMETFVQSQNDAAGAGGNSCMSCHYNAGDADFAWSLNNRAYDPNIDDLIK